MERITPYSVGIVSASVCALNECTIKEITDSLNISNPTGISSKWQLSKDKFFKDGISPNPCPCNENKETRKHYLFTC